MALIAACQGKPHICHKKQLSLHIQSCSNGNTRNSSHVNLLLTLEHNFTEIILKLNELLPTICYTEIIVHNVYVIKLIWWYIMTMFNVMKAI